MSTLPAADFALSVLGVPRFIGPSHQELTMTQRRIIERLALNPRRPARLEQLIDAVWDTSPPRHAKASIQNQISRIRAKWGDHVIGTQFDGYLLGATTDAELLLELSSLAEELFEQGELHQAHALADSIVPLWNGIPFADIEHVSGVMEMRGALLESFKSAENTRLGTRIALGHSGWVIKEAQRLVSETPHDEKRQAMLARALASAGRRGEALAAIATARHRLRADLGIDAGPILIAAEEEIQQPAAPAVTRSRPSFVGRERELRLALASLSRGTVVRVCGEPGSGVTRLLTEIAAQLRSLAVRTVVVDIADHLDSAVGVLRAVADEAGLEISAPQGLVAGFPFAATRASELSPIAILLDNADQLGPSARAAFLAAVSPRLMLVLGGHWLEPGDGVSNIFEVDLGPLDRAAVARLTALAATRPVTANEIDQLYSYSGGNPLVLGILLSAGQAAPESAFHDSKSDAASRLTAFADLLLGDLNPDDRATVSRATVTRSMPLTIAFALRRFRAVSSELHQMATFTSVTGHFGMRSTSASRRRNGKNCISNLDWLHSTEVHRLRWLLTTFWQRGRWQAPKLWRRAVQPLVKQHRRAHMLMRCGGWSALALRQRCLPVSEWQCKLSWVMSKGFRVTPDISIP